MSAIIFRGVRALRTESILDPVRANNGGSMFESRRSSSVPSLWTVLLLGVALCAPLGVALDATMATAAGSEEEQSLKEEWQRNYRGLLQERARLQRNAAAARADYKRAQRRNYPRGGAREQILRNAKEAEKGIVQVETVIEAFKVDARGAGVLPGWLYEIEEEEAEGLAPAAPAEEAARDDRDREGRNPIYFEDEDPDEE